MTEEEREQQLKHIDTNLELVYKNQTAEMAHITAIEADVHAMRARHDALWDKLCSVELAHVELRCQVIDSRADLDRTVADVRRLRDAARIGERDETETE